MKDIFPRIQFEHQVSEVKFHPAQAASLPAGRVPGAAQMGSHTRKTDYNE
ncbi:hypothetical protein SAMN05444172_8148 [Burkholderia sp. GAS332]|jgi:hypothetical protein|nr:hypothetical protein SAMN05444172_8148 [Burkholderia sp. GAS332]